MSIGFHISRKRGAGKTPLADVLSKADKFMNTNYNLDITTHQIFVGSPARLGVTIKRDEIDYLINSKNRVIVHGCYLDVGVWGLLKSGADPGKLNRIIDNIKQELKTCAMFNGKGVIIHLGRGQNHEIIMKLLKQLGTDLLKRTRLWLEIDAADTGEDSLTRPENLKRAIGAIPRKYNVGFCIDTAHVWAAGVSIRTREEARSWYKATRAAVPRRIPFMLHLNDSHAEMGSGKDDHSALTRGNIWRGYRQQLSNSGMAPLLKAAAKENMIVVMERAPTDWENDMDLLTTIKV